MGVKKLDLGPRSAKINRKREWTGYKYVVYAPSWPGSKKVYRWRRPIDGKEVVSSKRYATAKEAHDAMVEMMTGWKGA